MNVIRPIFILKFNPFDWGMFNVDHEDNLIGNHGEYGVLGIKSEFQSSTELLPILAFKQGWLWLANYFGELI